MKPAEQDPLSEAQMHVECLLEAWHEFRECFRPITQERKAVVQEEISSRIWAAIYLIQYRNEPDKLRSDDAASAIRLANAFNDLDDESVNALGLH